MNINNLCFQHHKQAPYFFKGLSFALEEGLIHVLHGKNGVGKSVFLNVLSGNMDAEALVSGEIISEKVELMNQQFDQALVGQFTFLENMQFGSLGRFPSPFARLKNPSHLMTDDYQTLLEKFHINLKLPVNKLSGGQRQILTLLMKLQRNAKVLLLDEPTATLDEQNAIMVFEFLKALKGVTILVVCHDQTLVAGYTTGKKLCIEIDNHGLRQLKEFF